MERQQKKSKVLCKGSAGFTLAELIVVLVIMGILTAAIVPVVTGYVATAREQVSDSDLRMVEDAARLYLTDQELSTGQMQSVTLTAQQLVTAGYLSAVPGDGDWQIAVTINDGRYTIQVQV